MDISTQDIVNVIFDEEREYKETKYRGIWQFEAANRIIDLINKKLKQESLERADLYECKKCGKIISWNELIAGKCDHKKDPDRSYIGIGTKPTGEAPTRRV